MNEEKIQDKPEHTSEAAGNMIDKTTDEREMTENPSDAQAELGEQYSKLPVWKQVVILVLCLGGMTAVIMLINFIVEFGAELIRALLK